MQETCNKNISGIFFLLLTLQIWKNLWAFCWMDVFFSALFYYLNWTKQTKLLLWKFIFLLEIDFKLGIYVIFHLIAILSFCMIGCPLGRLSCNNLLFSVNPVGKNKMHKLFRDDPTSGLTKKILVHRSREASLTKIFP